MTALYSHLVRVVRPSRVQNSAFVGSETARPPYCYVPPAYVELPRKLPPSTAPSDGSSAVASLAAARATLHPSRNAGGAEEEEADHSPCCALAEWDAALSIWRLLESRRVVRRGSLPFEALLDAAFEARAHGSPPFLLGGAMGLL